MTLNKDDVKFKAARSSGPGGQRTNRRSTKVEIWVSVAKLPLSDKEKEVVRRKLANHLNRRDEIWVENQETRSQEMNRDLALNRLNMMIREALKVPKARILSEPRRSAKESRLKEKKIISDKKRSRRTAKKR